jgi:hypothetical protein
LGGNFLCRRAPAVDCTPPAPHDIGRLLPVNEFDVELPIASLTGVVAMRQKVFGGELQIKRAALGRPGLFAGLLLIGLLIGRARALALAPILARSAPARTLFAFTALF